jgi:hypothetical protein
MDVDGGQERAISNHLGSSSNRPKRNHVLERHPHKAKTPDAKRKGNRHIKLS